MRLGFFLGCLGALGAWGEDARVDYLSKRLAEAEDLRLKMQLVVALGSFSREAVVLPLCRALRDKEPLVRQAAIKSLSRLHYFSRLPCLELALADSHTAVRGEAIRALQRAGSRLAGYGFVILGAESPRGDEVLAMSTQILRSKLSNMGARVQLGRRGELKRIPADKRYKLRVKALQEEELLKLEVLLMTFPGKSLRASFSVQARGKSVAVSKLLERMVQKLLEEMVEEMRWFGEEEEGG